MKVAQIKSNKDLLRFIRDMVSDISFDKIREDKAEAIFTDLIKHVSKEAIKKHFKKVEEYRKRKYFISLLCAGEKGYYTHITNGGESLIELAGYQDPEEAIKDAFTFVDHYDKTGEKLALSISKVEETKN